MDQRRVAGLPLVLLGITLGALWMSGLWRHPFVPVGALFLLLAGTSLLISKVGELARNMRPLLGKNVHVQVWGQDLPGNPGCRFTVCTVRALGAGLHLFLRPFPDGAPTHLKVAQPSGTQISNAGLEISAAKYVQWAGSKIKKVEGEMALLLTVNDELPRLEQ